MPSRPPAEPSAPRPAAAPVELRVLVGPNLYFPRPAVKLTLDDRAPARAPTERLVALAGALGLGAARPGPPGSAFRQRFTLRLVARLVRRVAAAAGVSRLAVRVRPGAEPDTLVVAYPWRHVDRAEALGQEVARLVGALDDPALDPAGLPARVAAAGERVRATPPGEGPRLLRPRVPVVAVTGTNGKTTTARMIAHVARRRGMSVGWSSTDGVYLDGVLVEAGDYSGPSGAGQVLRHPGVQLAVTETARGGILRRGVGVAWNDVSVVTNVSADHLGVDGIDTLDQLAEVKAVITRITRPQGWCVLNADDPRTFAMRLGTPAQVWVFTLDPASPAARTVLDAGGRVTTVLDGWVAVLGDGDPRPVVEVAEVPMTLAGLSRVNVENALAVASACLGLGFTAEEVAEGLRSFDPGTDNPGRMNVWDAPATGGRASVVVDLAHNEAGLEALLAIMRGLRPPGGRLLVGIGTAGDRGDDVLVRLGEVAALGADVVEVAGKSAYLRGRAEGEMEALLREGAAHAGLTELALHADEVGCLASLLGQARGGDVVGLMTHQQRGQVDAWLAAAGAVRDAPAALRAKVRRAAGGAV